MQTPPDQTTKHIGAIVGSVLTIGAIVDVWSSLPKLHGLLGAAVIVMLVVAIHSSRMLRQRN